MLGIGPLFLAPLSETFGRRVVYLLVIPRTPNLSH